MMPALQELNAQDYARDVLVQTHELWGGGRDFPEYVSQTAELAASAYGRRYYRTFALRDERGNLLATFKRYERVARVAGTRLRAMGIGAVFTPPQRRGCGYASAMLALALDEARRAGVDFAFLYSDIHPQFYKALGFVELSSRLISLRADSLPSARTAAQSWEPRDEAAIRRCFEAMTQGVEYAFERTPAFWEWAELRRRHRARLPGAQRVDLVLRRGRSLIAYVAGRRKFAEDAYAVDEFGFIDDDAAALVPSLLRAAAGDLRRITGWLPPLPARYAIPHGTIRRRKTAILMIAPLTDGGKRFLQRALATTNADAAWETDHV